jgi:predicted phosphodiesterase
VKTDPNLDHIYIVPLGDLHIADPAGIGGYTHIKNRVVYNDLTKKFQDMLSWMIENKNVYSVLMGDIFDTALKNSISNTYKAQYDIDDAKDYATEILIPFAKTGRLIGGIDGNHENRLYRDAGNSLVKDLCKRLGFGITYFHSQCGYLFLKVGNNKDYKTDKYRPYDYSVMFHHGRGGGSTSGGKLNSVNKMIRMAPADLYIMGHVHATIAEKQRYIEKDIRTGKLFFRKRYLMVSGCWLGYANYAIEGMYPPAVVGVGRARLNGEPKKHGWDIHVSI